MKILKIKNFKTYQAVRLLNDYITSFTDGDPQKSITRDNSAFYAPELAAIILKHKETGEEKFIPLTNIQDFTLCDELLKKSEEQPVTEPKIKKGK